MASFVDEFYEGSPPAEPPAQAAEPAVVEERPAEARKNAFLDEFLGPQPQRAAPSRPGTAAPPAASPSTAATAPARVPTRFQKARTAPVKPEPELTFADVAPRAVRNLPSSAAGVLKSTVSAFANPFETIEGLKQIGRGVISKGATEFGIQRTPEQRAQDEKILDSMIAQYAQNYGSKQGFYKALAEDPASILMDFATIVSGGAGAAGKAGLIGEKAALQVAKTASYLDPVQLAVKGAKTVGSGTAKVARGVSSVGTGVAPRYLQAATEVGSKGTPEQIALFKSMQKDPSKQIEIVDMALEGVKKATDERSSQYLSGKGGLSKTADVDFSDAGVRLGELRNQFTQKMTRGPDVVLDEGGDVSD